MNFALSYRVDFYPRVQGGLAIPIETYARSVDRALVELGHKTSNVYNSEWDPKDFDILLELDNGRDPQGNLGFGQHSGRTKGLPTAVWFVDSHGQPDLHKSLAPSYDHIFFAVWHRRDLFTGHKSAHWCPNATDPSFFYEILNDVRFNFGFFGSKRGLDRANDMVEICKAQNWSYDVRSIGKAYKHKWPNTCEAMSNCAILYNRGQKHDLNLRIFESMIVNRPLLNNIDEKNGMDQLFTLGEHYLGYSSKFDLLSQMSYAIKNPTECAIIAAKAQKLVMEKHLIKHRVEQMLSVITGA